MTYQLRICVQLADLSSRGSPWLRRSEPQRRHLVRRHLSSRSRQFFETKSRIQPEKNERLWKKEQKICQMCTRALWWLTRQKKKRICDLVFNYSTVSVHVKIKRHVFLVSSDKNKLYVKLIYDLVLFIFYFWRLSKLGYQPVNMWYEPVFIYLFILDFYLTLICYAVTWNKAIDSDQTISLALKHSYMKIEVLQLCTYVSWSDH